MGNDKNKYYVEVRHISQKYQKFVVPYFFKKIFRQCDQTLRFSAKPAVFEDPLRIFKPFLRNPQICGFSIF